MCDRLDKLLKALGPEWYTVRSDGWVCLKKGALTFVSARSRDGLFREFATPDDVFDEIDRRTFRIPEFLRCSSPEELAVKLEVANG